ncbi:MAG: hypothetical protein KIT84_31855 [Labilithrix sp.]|nr:hypothetical protein [Labilithrix sp.]MCW5815666.1 hypothetical protein [Labilithrix sp.]
MTLFGALQPFVTRRHVSRSAHGCELCGAPLDRDHAHLADVDRRALACACRPCALLFARPPSPTNDGHPARTRWRAVPERHLRDPSFRLEHHEWEALGIPVGIAFFFRSTAAGGWTAAYPSPAGPVESLLPLETWEAIAARTPLARVLEDDVEALLVSFDAGPDGNGGDCVLVPIHACYALVGRVRRRWRGLDGGDEGRAAVAEHLAALRDHAAVLAPEAS